MYVYVYIPFLLLHVKINLDEIHDINMIGHEDYHIYTVGISFHDTQILTNPI